MSTINGAESSRELKLICSLVRKWESQPLRENGFEKHGEFGCKCYGKLWPFKILITCDFFTVNFPSFKYIMNAANREILDGEHRRVFTLMKKVENFRCNAIQY